MSSERQPAEILSYTYCPATHPSHPDRPCPEWIAEFDKQAKAVAGGGLVKGRIASGGMVAARSVSDRAAESLKGVHRCTDVAGHVERNGTAHTCGCRFEWTEEGPVVPPPVEAGGPA
jgi:hypothetical protein